MEHNFLEWIRRTRAHSRVIGFGRSTTRSRKLFWKVWRLSRMPNGDDLLTSRTTTDQSASRVVKGAKVKMAPS
jgi:hypothetical protein